MIDEERRMFSNRLRERDAEIERLRAALEDIAERKGASLANFQEMQEVARRALEPKP